MSVKEQLEKYKDYSINLRREFHAHPEPSMKEYNTSKRVIEELEKMGIERRTVAGTGVIGLIKGAKPGKTVALRADMDALEVQEENHHAYRSKVDGIMHACGHDAHTAGLLTAAKILSEMRSQFNGTVKLLFQPGEETAQGAKAMVSEGVMEDVDGLFGLHVWNEIEAGKVSVEAGPRLASAGHFKIYVTGKGGHGSMPHQGVDATVVASAILMNLQSIVSREISPLDPAVVSIGIFNAGTQFNVMAGEAYLEGTTRCFSLEVNNNFEKQIARVVENTAKAYRAEAKLDYRELVIPTINDAEMSAFALAATEELFGKEAITNFEQSTGGEDFSYFTGKVPSAFAFVGCKNTAKVDYYPHHHPKFDIDEDALGVAAGLYAQFALNFLKERNE